VTKTKGAFVSEKALLKQVYVVLENVSSKWTQPIQNWSLTLSQLSIKFKERLELDLNINF
jgi:transposase-like protein